MLKTRQIPARKVLIDRSDIVAPHAKLLRGARRCVRVERRSEKLKAENVVIVLTYERAGCPILNQVPRRGGAEALREPLLAQLRGAALLLPNAGRGFARTSSDFYLQVYARIHGSHADLPTLRGSDAIRTERSRFRDPPKQCTQEMPPFFWHDRIGEQVASPPNSMVRAGWRLSGAGDLGTFLRPPDR